MNLKTIAAVAIAVTGALGAGLAQAHTDVQWSVNIGLPLPVIRLPLPVVIQPAPVYVQPGRVYEQPVYSQPYAQPYSQPVYTQPVYSQPYYAPRYATRWDHDGDGIPDRYDRHDNRRGEWRDGRHDDRHDGGRDQPDRQHHEPQRDTDWRR